MNYSPSDIDYLERIRKTQNIGIVEFFLNKPEHYFNALNTGIAVKDLTDITPQSEKHVLRKYIHVPSSRTFECHITNKPSVCGCECKPEPMFSWKEIKVEKDAKAFDDLFGFF